MTRAERRTDRLAIVWTTKEPEEVKVTDVAPEPSPDWTPLRESAELWETLILGVPLNGEKGAKE